MRQVFETVRRLDPTGEDILFVTGSDHGMETVADAIDLDGLLIAAGLKAGAGFARCRRRAERHRRDALFRRARGRSAGAGRAVSRRPRTGPARSLPATRWRRVGLPTDTAMRVAVTLAGDDRVNPHGVGGYCPIVQDPADNESKIGFGQHGGLGANEQRPFLMVEGGGFAPRKAAACRPR